MTQHDDMVFRPAASGGAGIAVIWAAGWLVAEGMTAAGLAMSGLVPDPALAGALALALTAPVALGLGGAVLLRRMHETRTALQAQVHGSGADAARRTARSDAVVGALSDRIDALFAPAPAPAMAPAPVQEVPVQAPAPAEPARPAPPAALAPAPAPALAPAPIAPPPPLMAQAEPPRAAPHAAPHAASEERQGALPLSDAAAARDAAGSAARDWTLVTRALDFPRDADDLEGFAALAAAVKDPLVSDLLQAAEDTLTLLAQHNVYMEDLTVEAASPEDWAAFINGARGPAVAAVGGVREAEAIDTVRALNRHDAIFRDTAMHLMRRYDVMMRRALEAPSGAHRLPDLANTRTGRAYMLAARAVGAFD
jgi:hypothetical protein